MGGRIPPAVGTRGMAIIGAEVGGPDTPRIAGITLEAMDGRTGMGPERTGGGPPARAIVGTPGLEIDAGGRGEDDGNGRVNDGAFPRITGEFSECPPIVCLPRALPGVVGRGTRGSGTRGSGTRAIAGVPSRTWREAADDRGT